MSKRIMYACFAFFPNGEVKRWKYVTNLTSFMLFLSTNHPAWLYFNVYKKDTTQFLKRFYPNNFVPKVLGLLILLGFLTARKNTFDKTTFGKTTFTYGFNNTTTIRKAFEGKKEGVCHL